MKSLLLSLVFFALCNPLFAQSKQAGLPVAKRIYKTKLTENLLPPVIDGILNDKNWDIVQWSGDFVQREPDDNAPPTEQTQFKIIYDNRNLYIAIRCFEKEPEKIVKRLSRRDGFEGDWVEVNLDSYHDLRSAFSFTITAAGVKGDEAISQNGDYWDESWNPVWYVKTMTDSAGWTTEMKIPFTQLRFGKAREQIWGLQVNRRYFSNNEMSNWQYIPRNAPGWVSEFGELHGLIGLEPQKQIEILPYMLSSLETFEEEKGNPFEDGTRTKLSGGVDGKVGVTNDLTLDFTINPDFGQVEADPSQIALDGFQLFFQERRPFFVENKNIFDYRISNTIAGDTDGDDNLFYSRRIGRDPQGAPVTVGNEYISQPGNTNILGAAKFSGKTRNGWSVGVLESVTSREYAKIDKNGERRKELIEPLTNYFTGRLQKDFNNRNTFIGGIFTATDRKGLTPGLDFLHKSAYSGGIDFKHQWKNRTWYLSGNVIASRVSGSPEAIRNTQENIARLYQRTDADYIDVDTAKTSLSGHGGNIQVGKAGGNFNFESGFTWRSPGLELNDIGFLRKADNITHYYWMGYRIIKPFSIFRSVRFNYNHWSVWDFGGTNNELKWNVNTHAQFKNNWFIGSGLNIKPKLFSNAALRGGPKLRLPDQLSNWIYINSDDRKKLRYGLETSFAWAEDNAYNIHEYSLNITYQPVNALVISLGPSYEINKNKLQFVKNIKTDSDVRYLNATIDQRTLSMSLRVNYTINPDLTIQYWGQPFISTGKYSDFKFITAPRAGDFEDRFHTYSENQISYNKEDQTYLVNENTNGPSTYSFADPDFSVVQFRSNLVLRWEYIPGSEIYLVWSQDITEAGDPGENLFRALDRNILGTQGQHIFLIKATYRFFL